MNTVEFLKSILKERHIPMSRIERDLGFANPRFPMHFGIRNPWT